MSQNRTDGWIGVDFDGTLAFYEHGRFPALGDPIPLMLERVLAWLVEGRDVRIFTARVSYIQGATGEGETTSTVEFAEEQRRQIEDWCEIHLGHRLPVTCTKDFQMVELWDDRCVQVIPNTGQALQELVEPT